VNVLGTVALLKAGADSGCLRFVYASSGGAIYGKASRLPTPERTTPRPLSPYGAAKLAAEGYLGMFARTFGLATLALRYSNVYGPLQDGTGEAGVVAITCQRLLSGRAPEIRGDGRQTRDFVFVGDVADANLRALRSEVTGPMNIGTGVATSIRSIVDELVRAAAYPGPIDFVQGMPGEVRDTALDTHRAAKLLGWMPSTSLPDGLGQTFTSFREQVRRPTMRATSRRAGAEARPGPGSRAGSE
jgi:UDP-glucose 4-epimerase